MPGRRIVAALAGAVLVASCGGDTVATTTEASPTSGSVSSASTVSSESAGEPDPRANRPVTFTTDEMTLVDESRPTPESANGPQLESRAIGVWLYLPETEDPAPLVVFSHGMGGHPDAFEELHAIWAESGYAVAAPIFPLTNREAAGGFTNLFDVPAQPGDVSFVLDELLARSADPDSQLAGRFDPERLAAAGLSAGGATTYEVAVNELVRDRRFDAAIVFAGLRSTSPENGTFEAPADLPVFILHGDADPLVEVGTAEAAYADLAAPRFFATLLGGGHAGPFQDADEGIETQVPGQSRLIRESTVAFLDRYVLGIDAAIDDLLIAADDPELGAFVFEVD